MLKSFHPTLLVLLLAVGTNLALASQWAVTNACKSYAGRFCGRPNIGHWLSRHSELNVLKGSLTPCDKEAIESRCAGWATKWCPLYGNAFCNTLRPDEPGQYGCAGNVKEDCSP